MKMSITKKWVEKAAKEEDVSVEAGINHPESPTAYVQELKNEIIDSINKRVATHDLHAEAGAVILLELSKSALESLDWLPQSKQAAVKDIESAIKWIHT